MSEKANFRALLPMIVFLVLFIGTGIALTAAGADMPFYQLSATVAIIPAIVLAILQGKDDLNKKIGVFLSGVGEINIITMCMIFLLAGGFASVASAIGGVKATVNFGLSLLPPSMILPGLFLIGAFISTAMGTSMGTVAAIAPIAVGVGEQTDIPLALLLGVVMSGAMFGDNLSMISDTTIAAVKTQGCEMKDKFRENFLIVLPAAIVTILLFLVLGKDASFRIQGSLDYSLLRVVPYMVVLAGALAGVNVFLVLMTGTVLSLIAGVATGAFGVGEMFTHVGAGITGMYDITVISVIVACIVALVKEYGGIAFILSFIKKRINGERGGELGIAALALLVDMCTANNTVAIVMAGPIAKEISDDFGVTPRRSASLLDMFSSMGQGLIPYGAQLLAAASLTGLTPFEIIPYCFYPILMGVSGLLFIFIKKRHGKVLV